MTIHSGLRSTLFNGTFKHSADHKYCIIVPTCQLHLIKELVNCLIFANFILMVPQRSTDYK